MGMRRAADQYLANTDQRLREGRDIDEFVLQRMFECPKVMEFEQALTSGGKLPPEVSSIAILLPNDAPYTLEDTKSLREFVTQYGPSQFVQKAGLILRRFGLEELIREVYNRLEKVQHIPLPDWTRAVMELMSALYDDDIEQSLRIQGVLNLYPLHKRMLGLVEYIIKPCLKSRGVEGNAPSSLWTNAFTGWRDAVGAHPGLSSASLLGQAGLLATLETEGNWLVHTADHEAAGGNGPIYLAALLDGILARMSSAGEVTGVSVNLRPPTPQVHARQLAALADRSSANAAYMTLYLGKIALMLRNATEHGIDRVVREGLLLEMPGYWTEERGPRNNRLPVFDWLKATATQEHWRSRTLLPARLPSAANAFLLTPASLQRCVVLLSLVLHAAFSHLGLPTTMR